MTEVIRRGEMFWTALVELSAEQNRGTLRAIDALSADDAKCTLWWLLARHEFERERRNQLERRWWRRLLRWPRPGAGR